MAKQVPHALLRQLTLCLQQGVCTALLHHHAWMLASHLSEQACSLAPVEAKTLHLRCSNQACLEGVDLRRMHLTPLG